WHAPGTRGARWRQRTRGAAACRRAATRQRPAQALWSSAPAAVTRSGLFGLFKAPSPFLLVCSHFHSDFESDFSCFFPIPYSSFLGTCFAKFLPSNPCLVSL